MENRKTNGLDEEEIFEKDSNSDSANYSLDDIATEDDDITITGENVLSHVQVRRPHKQEWFRCHPTWQLSTRAVVDGRNGNDVCYLLHRKLMPWSESLEQDSIPVLVRICINLKGKIFIWVIRKSKRNGDPSPLYETARNHADEAVSVWIRHFWIENENRHTSRKAPSIRTEPAWPEDVTLLDVIHAGFGSRIITDENARILRELRGEFLDD